jgi:hypothetical protein
VYIGNINFCFVATDAVIVFCPFHFVKRGKQFLAAGYLRPLKRKYTMNYSDDLQSRWWTLEAQLVERFGKKPDVETILFLIGIQELGDIRKKFSKEQKQDLMHVAVCTVLMPSGYYEIERVDEDGWPHFKQLKAMPEMNPIEQENFLKDHILLYFQNNELVSE